MEFYATIINNRDSNTLSNDQNVGGVARSIIVWNMLDTLRWSRGKSDHIDVYSTRLGGTHYGGGRTH